MPDQDSARFEALVRIGNIFNTERNLERLLSVIVEETYHLIGAELGSIFLLDDESGELWSLVATDLGDTEVIRIPKSTGIVGSVVDSAKPLIVPDPYADPRFNREVDKATITVISYQVYFLGLRFSIT